MSYPNTIEEINDIQTFIENIGSNIINLIYPVGSIYMSANNVSPATFLGGTWEQIQDRFLLCAGSTYSAGSTGGEATHKLTQAETPAHTHTRGTMEITGIIWSRSLTDGTYGGSIFGGSGAFSYAKKQTSSASTWKSAGNYTSGFADKTTLTASKNWTGATSSVGGNAAHNNMPPYLAVYVWKRTA